MEINSPGDLKQTKSMILPGLLQIDLFGKQPEP